MEKKPCNCWEFWKCPKEELEGCPAHLINDGKGCWLYTHGLKPMAKRDFCSCAECPWFLTPREE